jgi:hypothetical protein
MFRNIQAKSKGCSSHRDAVDRAFRGDRACGEPKRVVPLRGRCGRGSWHRLFDTEARRAQRYGTEVPEGMEGPGPQAAPAPSLPGDLQAAMDRRARIPRMESTGRSQRSWRDGVRAFRSSLRGSLLCALRRAHPCPPAPSAPLRSPRNRAVVRPLGAWPLHRRSLSPGQPCSSPPIHCSVKPLCSLCLRGEFSRRRCSAGRPAVPIATWALLSPPSPGREGGCWLVPAPGPRKHRRSASA